VSTTTSSPIESHAAIVYTRGAFIKCKEQFCASFSFKVERTSSDNELCVVYNGNKTKKLWETDAYDLDANFAEEKFYSVLASSLSIWGYYAATF
jgi:hypothetical protein